MRVRKVTLQTFKRFSNTVIDEIPPGARLIIMAGPNGSGKSSFFDAMNTWYRHHYAQSGNWDESYHSKQSGDPAISWNHAVKLEFYDPQPISEEERRKAIYVRTAYRNDPDFEIRNLSRTESALTEQRIGRLIDNDATVARNYARLASQGLEDIYERESADTTIGEFREKTIGGIRRAVVRLFPGLMLNSLGNPLTSGTFKFDKGVSKQFLYKNLSGGEKAAFDLLLDMIVKKREFDNTIFCIDEPEAHLNTRLQGALLSELYDLTPLESQLWLATHSIGMMRRARDLWMKKPDEVVFLDFGDRDFDQPQVIKPIAPSRQFWLRVLNVALDDLAELVAPSEVFICEGAPLGTLGRNVAIDAACYNAVFAAEFPDAQFLSGGNVHDVESDRLALIESIKALVGGTRIRRVVDRDDLSVEEMKTKRASGMRVLTRRHLESYLFDDEVLTALCVKNDNFAIAEKLLAKKAMLIEESIARGNPPDDIKSISGELYIAAKSSLGLTACGNTSKTFMRDTLAPLLVPSMSTYGQLRRDIFES